METGESSSSSFQVIVVGGGMAGLAACQRLIESGGVKSVLLLEAGSRLGGRIHSIPYQNAVIELGAQWIHGRKGNPLYEFANSLGQVDNKTKTEFGETTHCASQDGARVDEDFAENIEEKIEKIFDNLEDDIERLDERHDKPLKTMVDEKFEALLRKLKGNVDTELVRAIYKARLNDERFDTACEDLNEQSALGWNEFDYFDDDVFVNLKNGYGRIIDYLRSQIPGQVIHVNEPVELINWQVASSDRRAPVEVRTVSALDNTKRVYWADKVLVTVPLGFLKANHERFFYPRLPLEKTSAIERLGFGTVDKLFLIYDKPVLKPDEQGLQIFWRDDVKFSLDSSIAMKWNIQNDKFLQILDNYNVHPLLPNVMSVFVVGQDAVYIESLGDECLLDIFTDLLRKVFPRLNLPRPASIMRSKWNSNQFVRGSYSFVKMGSSTEDIKALGKSLNQKVFFAGEATHPTAYSSVHGAFESGRKAATKIVQSIHDS